MNSSNITVSLAGDHDHDALRRMMQLYLYDFSEFSEIPLDAQAHFGDADFIEQQFSSENTSYVFRVGGEPAGFAIVAHESWLTKEELVTDMAQFFVMRGYRRTRVGSTAALRLFGQYAGHWEVRVIEENVHALTFWRNIINSFTLGKYKEEIIEDPDDPGTVFRFESPE
jgi:predicted acetyltransferase